MAIVTQPIHVNGVEIPSVQIEREVQYHPAASLPEARYEAMRALVVRELLLQQAVQLGLADRLTAGANPDSVIEQLLKKELRIPEATEQECQTYYKNNRRRFYTAPIYEVSHILYLAAPGNEAARQQALEKAQASLSELRSHPALFEHIARRDSACSSAGNDGFLGQVTQGQTLPPFEAALAIMKPGEISAAPVETNVGYHIIKLHHRAEGAQLPFEVVSSWIADYLRGEAWKRALGQYIRILAGQANITGFKLEAASSPLVQ